jgi:hypothetical protein
MATGIRNGAAKQELRNRVLAKTIPAHKARGPPTLLLILVIIIALRSVP